MGRGRPRERGREKGERQRGRERGSEGDGKEGERRRDSHLHPGPPPATWSALPERRGAGSERDARRRPGARGRPGAGCARALPAAPRTRRGTPAPRAPRRWRGRPHPPLRTPAPLAGQLGSPGKREKARQSRHLGNFSPSPGNS